MKIVKTQIIDDTILQKRRVFNVGKPAATVVSVLQPMYIGGTRIRLGTNKNLYLVYNISTLEVKLRILKTLFYLSTPECETATWNSPTFTQVIEQIRLPPTGSKH